MTNKIRVVDGGNQWGSNYQPTLSINGFTTGTSSISAESGERQAKPVQKPVRFPSAVAVALTNGGSTLVSTADYARVRGFSWRVKRRSGYEYVASTQDRPQVILHRFIVGASKGQYVDHINGNTMDNRRENLRICTNQQNIRNSRKYGTLAGRPASSRLKGVYLLRAGVWRAQIQNVWKINLGNFSTEHEAAQAYDDAARKMFGEFARLNFPLAPAQPSGDTGGAR